jgi:uncharacterized protein (TIGR02466 family)
MSTHLYFSTPVYATSVSGDEYIKIQSEMQTVYDYHVQYNMFEDPWHNGRMEVTTTEDRGSFASDIFEMFETHHFMSFLTRSINAYVSSLDQSPQPFTVQTSWMSRNKPGSYSHIHSHIRSPSHISGVYYFKTNGKDGDIFFECPIPTVSTSWLGNNTLLQPAIYLQPQQGKLILFPSWLRHGVCTNLTQDTRLSVSFNALFNSELDASN